MLANLVSWLLAWGERLAVTISNFFVDFINLAIVAFVALVTAVAGLLPAGTSLPSLPAVPSDSIWLVFIECLNWLFPMSFIASASAFIVAVTLAYVVIAPLARWVKLLR